VSERGESQSSGKSACNTRSSSQRLAKKNTTGVDPSFWIQLLVSRAGWPPKRQVVFTQSFSFCLTCRRPVLALDVWEHAFYLDFHNMKQDYVRVFLEKLVDWSFVAETLRFVFCSLAASSMLVLALASLCIACIQENERALMPLCIRLYSLHTKGDVHMNSHERTCARARTYTHSLTRDQKSLAHSGTVP